ncbi:MAG: zinc-finger domain-containing protein [Candidatus Berkiellales bacterium]
MTAHHETITASAAKQYQVTSKDLPLSCPMPDMILWNAHPRVYLPIEKTGKALCPYCSATYILKDFQHGK